MTNPNPNPKSLTTRWMIEPATQMHRRSVGGSICASVVIGGHRWSSVVIGGHRWSSVVIGGHRWSSVDSEAFGWWEHGVEVWNA